MTFKMIKINNNNLTNKKKNELLLWHIQYRMKSSDITKYNAIGENDRFFFGMFKHKQMNSVNLK